ncbi:MAG: BBP7 family outer membrane beta-barrel protein [Pirellulales bacterium]|nr:BBP7 family outer membrane beta-barrel protein [Pirellulales bacterium]
MKSWKPLLWIAVLLAVPCSGGRANSAEPTDVGRVDMGPGYAVPASGLPIDSPVPTPEFNPDNPWGPPPPGTPPCEPATTCCGICGQGSCNPPCWYLEQGVRILTRNRARHEGLVFREVDANTHPELLSTKSDTFDIAPGYLAKLGRYIGRDACNNDRFVEVSFWGLNQWDVDAGASALHAISVEDNQDTPNLLYRFGGDLVTPFPEEVIGFQGADTVQVDYDHSVNNIELNYWVRPRARADRLVLQPNGRWVRQCQPGCYVSHVFGLRAMTIDDGFAMRSRGTVAFRQAAEPFQASGDYLIDAGNTLLGFQLGTDLVFRSCRWSWGGRFRVAPFINLAEQDSQIFADQLNATHDGLGPRVAVSRSADDEGAAAAIELGFMADYRLSPHCVVELGYDLMWVPGVALAPDQIDFNLNGLPDLNNNATLFYHGLTMSLEIAW